MLKILFLFFITFPALACSGFLVEGKLAVDGQTWKFNRRFHLGQEEMVPVGPYIVSMTFTFPENGYRAKYKIEEKKGASLVLITRGEEDDLATDKSRDIFARGETGQPNSIITVQLKEIP